MDDESPNVADNLENTSCHHARHETPCLHLDALEDVESHGQSEYSDENGIGGNIRLVSQYTRLEGT